jgi:MerR family transcriptional regulator, heat shock protein HspR
VRVPRPDDERGVYGISVAAELVGTGVQNLRAYEARGLLEPERTEGGTRRYSANDLDRLRRIGDLLEAGLNLAGVAMVMDLEDENTQLRAEKEEQSWLKTASIMTDRSQRADPRSGPPRAAGPARPAAERPRTTLA